MKLAPGTVLVWWLAADAPGPAALACLTPAERARAARLRAPAGARFAAARAALRRILAAVTGGPARTLDLRTDPRGRPYLPGGPAFNASHSAGHLLCAVTARGRVGVDVEAARGVAGATRLAGGLFGEAFGGGLENLPPGARDGAFLRAWTRAEALLKAAGSGWSGAPPLPDVADGAASVCLAGHRYRLHDLPLPGAWTGALATDFPVRALRWCAPLPAPVPRP